MAPLPCAIAKTLARRTGEAKAQVTKLNEQAGRLITRSVSEAQRLIAAVRASARGRGAQVKLRAPQSSSGSPPAANG